jgi:hypothetical protein
MSRNPRTRKPLTETIIGVRLDDLVECFGMYLLRAGQLSSLGDITWQLDPAANGLQITDCDGTADKEADILVDEDVEFWVMIRVTGAKTDSLDLTCLEILEQDVDDLCLNNGVKLTYHNDKAFTKVMFNVSDNAEEEVEWGLSTSTGFRMAQVRIYEKL